MDLEQQLNELKTHMTNCEAELLLLKSGRKASSARLRKSLMNIKTGAHGMRSKTTEFTRALPTKTRAKKQEVVITPPEIIQPEPEPELNRDYGRTEAQSPKPVSGNLKKKRVVKPKKVVKEE